MFGIFVLSAKWRPTVNQSKQFFFVFPSCIDLWRRWFRNFFSYLPSYIICVPQDSTTFSKQLWTFHKLWKKETFYSMKFNSKDENLFKIRNKIRHEFPKSKNYITFSCHYFTIIKFSIILSGLYFLIALGSCFFLFRPADTLKATKRGTPI